MSARTRLCCVIGLVLLATGCVHSYQPLSGLHRPVVVDIEAANFPDLRLTVVCPPDELVSADEAEMLCDRVSKLFQNQGATVTTSAGGRPVTDALTEDIETAAVAAPTTDLVLELRSRETHSRNSPLAWMMCIGSATLIPMVNESSFAQDVVIRDGTGFLLVSDRLEGRLVRTVGVTNWAGNKLLDLVRKDEDKSKDDAVHAALSADLYGQLSQLVFNATMRWRVLQQATPTGRATAAPP